MAWLLIKSLLLMYLGSSKLPGLFFVWNLRNKIVFTFSHSFAGKCFNIFNVPAVACKSEHFWALTNDCLKTLLTVFMGWWQFKHGQMKAPLCHSLQFQTILFSVSQLNLPVTALMLHQQIHIWRVLWLASFMFVVISDKLF